MSARQSIADKMTADATLMALLTGGVYTRPQLTPAVNEAPFDAVGRMLPAALVRQETVAATGPRQRFDRVFVLVFFYDAAGYATIDQALDRTRALLHEWRPGGNAYEVRHTDDVTDQYDDALLAFMHRSRFEFTRLRG